MFNPIPTGHGRNQPIYERHVTKSGRNRVKKEPFFQAYDVAVEHFLSALNFQAGPGLATGSTKQNNTQDLKRKVMSDNVWSSLRLSLGLMGKRELYPLIEQRNLEKLNEILKK